MIHYDSCPLCAATTIEQVLQVKDHTVSGEVFQVLQCRQCTGRFTQDVPTQENIAPYYASTEYISHSNTQKGFINTLYHKVRNITLGAKRKLIIQATGLRKGKILDVGCGTGAFLNEMQIAGWNITGLEPDELARSNARKLYAIHPLPSPEIFALPAKSYEAITLWHVLEHVHQLHAYVDELKRLLTDSGRIFIAVPNFTSHDASHYQATWAAYDTPRHLYHFSPASMRQLMQQHGLKVIHVKPMWFDSFYVSMLSEKYSTGQSNVIKACWTGLISNLKTLGNKEKCSSVIYVIEKKTTA